MRLFFTSDLHGREILRAGLLTAVEAARPDIIVLGGDLLPDDSALKPETLGHGQPEYVRTSFRQIVTDLRRLSGCREVLVIFGNHDWGSSVTAMNELVEEGLVTTLEHTRSVGVDGLHFVGYSCTPPTPWFVKDFERLDKPGDRPPFIGGARWDARFSRPVQHGAQLLFQDLETIEEQLSVMIVPSAPWVFVVHAPPRDTNLDRAFGAEPYGSQAIREAIEKHQPLLSLHGHIHESPTVTGHWRDTLGATTAVNPGQGSKHLNYAVIDIDVEAGSISKMERGQQS
jgi:Icc-related predicted phosphoesterase